MTERHSDDFTLLLHAALDGELDAAGAMDVEGRLSADLALAAEYTRLIALRDAIRTRLPRERAPDALRARVVAMAQTPSQIKPTTPRHPWLLIERYRPLAASLVLGSRWAPAPTSSSNARQPTTMLSVHWSQVSSGGGFPARP